MKYLKKFESKTPIDIESDIEEFWELFGDTSALQIKNRGESYFTYIKKITDDIINEYGITMTDDYRYYDVCSVDDYGRPIKTLVTVKAVNKNHARIKASIIRKDSEIITTGFYGAEEIDIESRISSLEEELKRLKSIK